MVLKNKKRGVKIVTILTPGGNFNYFIIMQKHKK